MGIDYGDARTGIAISDLLCSIVGSTTVIHSRNDDKTIAGIKELIAQNGVGELVM
jgi:putative Holliday junction resolvase